MYFLNLLLLLLMLVVCQSCQKSTPTHQTTQKDGVTTIKNQNTPVEPVVIVDSNMVTVDTTKQQTYPSMTTLDSTIISPKKILTINAINDTSVYFSKPLCVDISKIGNIYILDTHKSSIAIFNSKGKYLKNFARAGQGPGELLFPNALCILGDTVCVISQQNKKLIKYDLEGNFIYDIPLEVLPSFIKKSPDGKRLVGFVQSFSRKENIPYLKLEVTLLDNNFRPTLILSSNEKAYSKEANMLDLLVPYAISDNEVYISDNSEDRYSISVYAFSGKKTCSIQKNYRKIKLSQSEAESFDNILKKINGKNSNTPKLNAVFKKAINNIFYDGKNNLLLVAASVERNEKNKDDFILDIYKKGIFLNRINLKFSKGKDFFNVEEIFLFLKDKIYLLNTINPKLEIFKL